ncbi:hypothetical protein [Metabacillus idriensis]|uniref:hypothetical protein n=1 Tax=Metabacillus idriensis TaxID=324768 RepID=UPI00174D1D13|nr:hypothetical protein [Metabacillus idriensis]
MDNKKVISDNKPWILANKQPLADHKNSVVDHKTGKMVSGFARLTYVIAFKLNLKHEYPSAAKKGYLGV